MCNGVQSILVVQLFVLFSVFAIEQELYEGSQCTLEDGTSGECKKLPDCPVRLQEVKEGKRDSDSLGRCGFADFTEIVCCPINIREKSARRPAEVACQEYDVNITITNEKSRLSFHIFGGVKAQAGEFPYMVALGYQNNNLEEDPSPITYSCGGSLISPQHVLTAAHCVKNLDKRVPIEVRLGDENIQSTAETVQRVPISDIISHPEYKLSALYNDVAILKLKTKLQISKRIKPICLQTRSLNDLIVTPRASFITIGWGATDIGADNSPTLMKTYSLEIVDREACRKSFNESLKLPRGLNENMICAIDPNVTRRSDACQGDSGGPLLMMSQTGDTVIGITAFGQSCGSATPGVYTAIHSYLDWIEEHVWVNNEPETSAEPEPIVKKETTSITKISIITL